MRVTIITLIAIVTRVKARMGWESNAKLNIRFFLVHDFSYSITFWRERMDLVVSKDPSSRESAILSSIVEEIRLSCKEFMVASLRKFASNVLISLFFLGCRFIALARMDFKVTRYINNISQLQIDFLE